MTAGPTTLAWMVRIKEADEKVKAVSLPSFYEAAV